MRERERERKSVWGGERNRQIVRERERVCGVEREIDK